MNQDELNNILAEHKKWLADKSTGKRADLRGVNLSGANLSGADLHEAYLYKAYLYKADLRWTNLYKADLRWTNLYKADLNEADLNGANLYGANLYGANLRGADLSGANLRVANMNGANLCGAQDIVSFGPVGSEKRIGYAVKHDNCVMVQLGCFWGTTDEAVAAIEKKYGPDSKYAALVLAAAATLED